MTNEEVRRIILSAPLGVDEDYCSLLPADSGDLCPRHRIALQAAYTLLSQAYDETIKLTEQRAQKNALLSSERHSEGDVYEAAADEARYIGSLIVELKSALEAETVSA